MENNRPFGHQRKINGEGKSVYRREKLGGKSFGGSPQRFGGGKSPIGIIIMLLILFLGGGGGLGTLLNGSSPSTQQGQQNTQMQQNSQTQTGLNDVLNAILSSTQGQAVSGVSHSWSGIADNRGKLNTQVHAQAREKFVRADESNTVTIMVYMCGTDLESKHGMGTSDLMEMTKADLGENVNLLVYTGGARAWKNNVISSRNNQIYKITNSQLEKLQDEPDNAMTDPDTLTGFINFCRENYPAQRNQLIFWDHGGGSVTGFGYDERHASAGAMDIGEIKSAIEASGMKFDFIGFDACLMATTETALALSDHADYMIASEETEPGTGWYYTNWLNLLAKNPSESTLAVGKQLIDDFVDVSARQARGQSTTLSLVDLAEAKAVIPPALRAFSSSTSALIVNKEFAKVSDARNSAREFARSSGIDQVDMVNLAHNMGTEEGKELAEAILGTVKYNRTSDSMANSYGLSIYFPYKKMSKVDTMVNTYKEIGMDNEYAKCIQQFAGIEASGQAASGSSPSPFPTLLGSGGGSISSELIGQLLGSFLGGDLSAVSGLDASNIGFLSERALSQDELEEYIAQNRLDASLLVWQEQDGRNVLKLSEEQWSFIKRLELATYVDDGSGYIEMGLDNVFDFDADGNLLADSTKSWIAVEDQPVAYYHIDDIIDGENYTTIGRIPVLLNGTRADLMVIFDNAHPDGYIAGARTDYIEGETDTIAKSTTELTEGDVIDFVAAYYDYAGNVDGNYLIGDALTVGSLQPRIGYVTMKENLKQMYKIRDLYGNIFWTPTF